MSECVQLHVMRSTGQPLLASAAAAGGEGEDDEEGRPTRVVEVQMSLTCLSHARLAYSVDSSLARSLARPTVAH